MFQVRLPPEVNRILYVRNLPYKITAEEMYDIFGKYGALRQIRMYVAFLFCGYVYCFAVWAGSGCSLYF